jgi:hypothetical protein
MLKPNWIEIRCRKGLLYGGFEKVWSRADGFFTLHKQHSIFQKINEFEKKGKNKSL